MHWIGNAAHARWLENETDRILDFGRAAALPSGGFGWLNAHGVVRSDVPVQLWITARMTHSYALGTLLGRPGAGSLADHGIAALNGLLYDDTHGGWFASATPDGPVDDSKPGYPHQFVLLAGASATAANRPGGREFLDRAIAVIDEHFWDESAEMYRESWDRRWGTTEAYRGGNANMHGVEACLAVADATGQDRWLERALSISHRLIHRVARENHYRVVEHFDERWQPLMEYNTGDPAPQFRAYGSTPGHWTEWSRLLIHLHAALEARGLEAPGWLIDDARGLFDAAIRDAWSVDGAAGFVYSVDWTGAPVIRERIRWVPVEAIGGAYALYCATGDSSYATWYETLWDFCRTHLMDFTHGSWHQELSPTNEPSNRVWEGKADIYHLFHALLVPRLPLTPYLASGLAAGGLDAPCRDAVNT